MRNAEHKIQMAIVRYLRMVGLFVFAVPNGGNRDAITGAYLKAEGVMSGVADLVLLLPGRCIFIEIKTPKGTQQDSQKIFAEKVAKLGYSYYIWRSLDDAIKFVESL